MPRRPTVYLLVGLPASGKTTRARELETEHDGLRFTPDEWMIPLFGESEAGGKRDVLEGRLLATALRALEVGVTVVLDFGFWGRDERTAVRVLAAELGARSQVVYTPIEEAAQWERVEQRFRTMPEQTFPITVQDLATWRAIFQVPDDDELAGRTLDPVPTGYPNWGSYAAERWPSLRP